MTHIVVIAGPIGAGKTTLARALAAQLGDAAVLQFDAYERLTEQGLDTLARWLREGADFNAHAVPQLRADLEKLKRGEAITTPLGEPVPARRWVLFEMPLGREHAETAPLIDLLIWIDLPPEIALARKLREFTANAARENVTPAAAQDFAAWLHGYLEAYLLVVREVLAVQERRVRPGAELVIDGCGNPAEIAGALASAIRRACP